MSFDARKLFDLLPAILRSRDQAQAVITPGWLLPADRTRYIELLSTSTPLTVLEQQQLDRLTQSALAGPLASLLAVFAETFGALQEDLDQLYDDQFIETCADWLTPYIGDLIGYRPLHGQIPKIISPRAEVAHTIAYRRRKGTVLVLEQLARDVTGWNATAVEFFQHLVMTQYMNHLRPQCIATPDLRQWEPLQRLGSPFDTIMHSVDVRRISSQRGRYNIPNIGLILWRLDAYSLTGSPAVPVDAQRWRFHPLGIDQPLYNHPQTIAEFAQLSTPLNVPEPISRRALDARINDYYSQADQISESLCLFLFDNSSGSFLPIKPDKISVCNLSDLGASWANLPTDHYSIDPVLGRIALPPGLPPDTKVHVNFYYGYSGDLGGGEYDRSAEISAVQATAALLKVPNDHATIQAALDALGANGGVVEITDSGRYEETLSINVVAGKSIELRAANLRRPALVLGGELSLSGGALAEIRLSGLLITGNLLRVKEQDGNALAKLQLSHCTLVPGWSLKPDCTPQHPQQPALVVETSDVTVTIMRTIVGALYINPQTAVSATDSIIDATATSNVAYAAADGSNAGGSLQLEQCTVIGKLHALKLPLVSNCILLASLATGDSWSAPINADRRQEGCVRFSYLPATARAPRRYHCLPESADSENLATPRFTTLRYGNPAYAQLATSSGAALLTGADNEGQPGAYNFLFQPQRETNLRVRLDEYLRIGLEAGIFYAS